MAVERHTEGWDITPSSLISDSTYKGYPYAANLTVQGCTASDSPLVIPDGKSINDGLFYNVAVGQADSVRVYLANNTFKKARISEIILEKGVE